MRTYFRSLSDVLGSPLAQTAQAFSPRHAGGHRVLKSTKLEDAAYRDLRRDDEELDAIDGSAAEGDDDIAPEADTDDDIAEDEE